MEAGVPVSGFVPVAERPGEMRAGKNDATSRERRIGFAFLRSRMKWDFFRERDYAPGHSIRSVFARGAAGVADQIRT